MSQNKYERKWLKSLHDRYNEIKGMANTNSYVAYDEVTTYKRVYKTHMNGAQPYKIVAQTHTITIRMHDDDPKERKTPVMVVTKFLGYWCGFDSGPEVDHNSSILIQIDKHNYLFVGAMVYNFETDDEILDFASPVGRNDVPYPVGFGQSYLYFMDDKKMVKRTDFVTPITIANAYELYREFYGNVVPREPPSLDLRQVKVIAEFRHLM